MALVASTGSCWMMMLKSRRVAARTAVRQAGGDGLGCGDRSEVRLVRAAVGGKSTIACRCGGQGTGAEGITAYGWCAEQQIGC